MSALVPLFQTALWVGLIIWIILRYNKQVAAMLSAVQDRITRGSSIKAGPFELGQDIRPQDIQQQAKRIEDEVQQLETTTVQALPAPTTETSRPSNASLRRRYLLAEDLTMRELQSEFGAPINRAVSFSGVELDGIFAKDGGGFGVEVKYIRQRIPVDRLLPTLSHIQQALQRLGWRRFTIILVFVCESDDAASPSDLERIQAHATQIGITLITRVYTLNALTEKFGIELQNTDNAKPLRPAKGG